MSRQAPAQVAAEVGDIGMGRAVVAFEGGDFALDAQAGPLDIVRPAQASESDAASLGRGVDGVQQGRGQAVALLYGVPGRDRGQASSDQAVAAGGDDNGKEALAALESLRGFKVR